MPEELFNKFIEAVDKLSKKIDNLSKASADNSLDSLIKTKKPKLKQLFDYTKSEFKDYLQALLTLGKAANFNNQGLQDGEKPLAEEGAKKVGGRIVNVKIEDINPRIVKLLRDELVEALGEKKTERERTEAKKPNWLLALLALLAGVLVGIFDFVKDWFKRLKGFLTGLRIADYIGDVLRFFKVKFFDFISDLFKALKETKFGQALSGLYNRILARIKNSKLFQSLARLFSEESFLGRLIRRIGRIFNAEGAVGRGIKSLGKAVSILGTVFKKIRGFVGTIVQGVKGVFGTIANIIKNSPLFKIGRIIGRLLGPIIAIFDIITNTINSVKEQGLNFKAVLDGVLGGILSFFTIGILNFQNIKKITDKITEAFSEGNIVEGTMRILLALPDLIFQGIGKVLTWVSGFFGEDFKTKVQDFFSGSFTDKVFSIFNSIKEFLLWPIVKMLEFVKKYFDIDVVGWFQQKIANAPGWLKALLSGSELKVRPETTNVPTSKPAEQASVLEANKDQKDQQENLTNAVEKSNELTKIKKSEPESSFDTEDLRVRPPEFAIANTMQTKATNNLDVNTLIKVLTEQLDILKQVRDNIMNVRGGTAVSSVSNNTIVQNAPNSIDIWRKSVLAN